MRPVKKLEWEKLATFNAAEYSPTHILTNKIYYDWQFDNFANPRADSYTTIGMFHSSGEIIGTFGCFGLPYALRGSRVMGNCGANLIVKKNLQNLGYGYLLLDEIKNMGDVVIDHTINDHAWPLFIKTGWEGENQKRYLYVINPKNNLYDFTAAEKKEIGTDGFTFERIKKFDDEIDAFWAEARMRYPVTIERTKDFLNWRYAMHPLVSYVHIVARKHGAVKALAVIRSEEVRDEKPIGVRAARMIDFVSDTEADLAILGHVVTWCRSEKIDFIDYFSSGKFHDAALVACGFVRADAEPYVSLPLVFNPITMKRKHLNFAVKKIEGISLDDWYTNKGGGDQDRPY